MHKLLSLLFTLLFYNTCYPEINLSTKQAEEIINNLKQEMLLFTQKSHYFGSHEQKKYAQYLFDTMKKNGLTTEIQEFEVKSPINNATNKNQITERNGYNIIALHKGQLNCTTLIGGHFDTKYFNNIAFEGANDGGSSTVLLINFYKILSLSKKSKLCNLLIAFFDGEEAILENWNDAENLSFNIQDHLYGSTYFVQKLKNNNNNLFYKNMKITNAIIIDMIGHKNQKIILSQHSNTKLVDKYIPIALKHNIEISSSTPSIEDDHLPFVKQNIPVLHIIDFINTNEWHTAKDTKAIINYNNILKIGTSLADYLTIISKL